MHKKIDVIALGTLVAQLVCVLLLVWVAYKRQPVNHLAVEIRWTLILGVIGVLYGIFLLFKNGRNSMAVTVIIVSILFISIIVMIDRYNVLVQYDRWINRGMPVSPLFVVPK